MKDLTNQLDTNTATACEPLSPTQIRHIELMSDKQKIEMMAVNNPAIYAVMQAHFRGDAGWETCLQKLVLYFTEENENLKNQLLNIMQNGTRN